jgi:hypothetical protein
MTSRTIFPIVAAVGAEDDEGKFLMAPFESDRPRSDDDDDDDDDDDNDDDDDDDDDDRPSIWTPSPETEEASWPDPNKEDDDDAIE